MRVQEPQGRVITRYCSIYVSSITAPNPACEGCHPSSVIEHSTVESTQEITMSPRIQKRNEFFWITYSKFSGEMLLDKKTRCF